MLGGALRARSLAYNEYSYILEFTMRADELDNIFFIAEYLYALQCKWSGSLRLKSDILAILPCLFSA